MSDMKRRSFLTGLAGIGAAGAVSSCAGSGLLSQKKDEIPKRVLGRTGVEVPILAFGGACMGHAFIGKEKAVPLIHEAIDLGVTYIDTARIYDDSEIYLGEVLPSRRDEVFLIEKVWAKTYQEAEKSFETSLRNLKVDTVDLLHVHNYGAQDVETVMGPGGSLEFVMKMKEQGKTRFIGITGHTGVDKFPAALETGVFDVLMVNLNFVDRHTYNFQDKVLPIARKHNMGIVAMKVLGGRKQDNFQGWNNYKTPGPGNMPPDLTQDAIRYCLSLEGVATAVVGMYTPDDLRKNVAWAKAFQPLNDAEMKRMEILGKNMAQTWGPHLGAV